MNITDAVVLSRKKSTRFFAEVFAYQSNEEISVEGIVDNFNESLYSNTHDTEEDIIINSKNFGRGIVRSILVTAKNQGSLDKRIRVIFEIFKAGNEVTLSSEYPSIPVDNFKYVKSFNESSSCNINQETNEYTHSVNVKLTEYSGNALSSAKTIASAFLNSNNLQSSNLVPSSYNDIPQKTFFDETYDETNGECNFTQKYEIANNEESIAGYNIYRSCSINYSSNGVASVTESAEYQDLTGIKIPTEQAEQDMNNAYSRCSQRISMLNSTASSIGALVLKSTPLNKGMLIDVDVRRVSYKITFSTDIKIDENNSSYITYVNTIETNPAGIQTYSLAGEILGMGDIDVAVGESTKYINAQRAWRNISTGSIPQGATLGGIAGKPYSFSSNHNKLKGTISYNITYTNSPSIVTGAGAIRRKMDTIIEDIDQRNLFQTFKIIHRDELIQKSKNIQGNTHTMQCTVNGDSTGTMNTLIKQILLTPASGSNTYSTNTSVTFDSTKRELTSEIQVMRVPTGVNI